MRFDPELEKATNLLVESIINAKIQMDGFIV